jgi:hypothetical protein
MRSLQARGTLAPGEAWAAQVWHLIRSACAAGVKSCVQHTQLCFLRESFWICQPWLAILCTFTGEALGGPWTAGFISLLCDAGSRRP